MPGRIDAHHHHWRPARGDYGWLRPDVPALAPLWRDFLPADFTPLRLAAGVQQSVLVQAAPSTAETDFMLALADAEPSITGVVGWVDLTDAASITTLQRWALHPAFKGVRPMLQDLPDDNWLDHAPHPAVLQALQQLGLRFDALVQPWHLPALLRFVQRWPGLPVVIDHAAKPQLRHGWSAEAHRGWATLWRQQLPLLAAQPQVCAKLSGLLTECAPAQGADVPTATATLQPVFDALLQHFGAQRLMWGSDWPVLNLAADHGFWVAVTEALLAPLPAPDRDALWQATARRFYGLPAEAGA